MKGKIKKNLVSLFFKRILKISKKILKKILKKNRNQFYFNIHCLKTL